MTDVARLVLSGTCKNGEGRARRGARLSPARIPLFLVLGICAVSAAMAAAKPLPTHVCSPRMGDNNDRQAFIGFDDGSVQWCLSRNQCTRLEGLPDSPSRIVAFSCEREQFVWIVRADGLVYRCMGAMGRKSCEKVPIQQ